MNQATKSIREFSAAGPERRAQQLRAAFFGAVLLLIPGSHAQGESLANEPPTFRVQDPAVCAEVQAGLVDAGLIRQCRAIVDFVSQPAPTSPAPLRRCLDSTGFNMEADGGCTVGAFQASQLGPLATALHLTSSQARAMGELQTTREWAPVFVWGDAAGQAWLRSTAEVHNAPFRLCRCTTAEVEDLGDWSRLTFDSTGSCIGWGWGSTPWPFCPNSAMWSDLPWPIPLAVLLLMLGLPWFAIRRIARRLRRAN